MAYKDYKHALVKPETHQKLKIYQYSNELKSFDEAINRLLNKEAQSE